MTPSDFLKVKTVQDGIIKTAKEAIRHAYDLASQCPIPKNLRKAIASDIVENAIIWYPDWENRKWCIVLMVRCPDDDFKAFIADDGCRYGLDGAYVELTSSPH